MKKEEAEAIFTLAGIPILSIFQIRNEYWGNDEQMQKELPWWLVKTKYGLIKIGWRKRVISIDWSDTGINQILTTDNVTKAQTLQHAYSHADAVKYMDVLAQAMKIREKYPLKEGEETLCCTSGHWVAGPRDENGLCPRCADYYKQGQLERAKSVLEKISQPVAA
jgi:hypothetical protein